MTVRSEEIAPALETAGARTKTAGEAVNATPSTAVQIRSSESGQHSCTMRLDELTGLPNRRAIWRFLDETIAHASSGGQLVALLVVDVDRFRFINKSIGYDRADRLLQQLAQRIDACAGEGAFVARHGVDEFAVVLTGIRHARDAAAAGERIARTVADPFTIDDVAARITCSIGISLYSQDGSDAYAMVRYANLALHRAKEIGRNNLQFFAPELNERVVERARLEIALRSAVENQEILLHYQPLADLRTGMVSGLEALSRWSSSELGEVAPDRFIAVAEECGLIEQLGEWAVRRVCMDIRDWLDSGVQVPRVAVNVSPRQFRDPQLANRIANAMSEFGINADRICLEITENVLMQDTPASEATLARLRALGIDLVLDDFGTGYSSLGYLRRYSFSKVKIDRSFIENMVSDSDDAAIARTVVSMAHSLGIAVVAEGVETAEQCDFLRKNMCDEIQGFLYSRPLHPDAVLGFLKEKRSVPTALLRLARPARTLLLVDDEASIVAAIKRLLRPDNYTILTANSGSEGLDLLARHPVDVIVSDQRMPEMTGVEFLRCAKDLYPDTVRIVLSGYTELRSVTDAVNEGAIYKFLTKPWDDSQLRSHIDEAFRRKEMADENRRLDLEVRTANFDLAVANRRLEEIAQLQQQQIRRDEVSLHVVREALRHVPLPVIGLDEDDCIAFINVAAQDLLRERGSPLGCDAREVIPELVSTLESIDHGSRGRLQLKGAMYSVNCHRMGQGSDSRGVLLTLTREAT